jgi:cytoskeletal protein CcmA (bactofilin family)
MWKVAGDVHEAGLVHLGRLAFYVGEVTASALD